MTIGSYSKITTRQNLDRFKLKEFAENNLNCVKLETKEHHMQVPKLIC